MEAERRWDGISRKIVRGRGSNRYFGWTYRTFAIPPVAIVIVNHVHVKCRILSLIANRWTCLSSGSIGFPQLSFELLKVLISLRAGGSGIGNCAAENDSLGGLTCAPNNEFRFPMLVSLSVAVCLAWDWAAVGLRCHSDWWWVPSAHILCEDWDADRTEPLPRHCSRCGSELFTPSTLSAMVSSVVAGGPSF